MQKRGSHLEWAAIETTTPQDHKIFKLYHRISKHPATAEAHRFVILDCPNWINVIALTPKGEVVLIRQFRHGTSDITLEIPGGMVEEGEDPLETAKRELAEETGFHAPRWFEIGKVQPNPAFQTNECRTFLALDAALGDALSPDPGEVIDTLLLPLAEIPALISAGEIQHSLVITAFFFYLHRFGSWNLPPLSEAAHV